MYAVTFLEHIITSSLFQSVAGSWEESYSLVNTTVGQMTLDEKISIVIGIGQLNPNCLSNAALMYDHMNHI